MQPPIAIDSSRGKSTGRFLVSATTRARHKLDRETAQKDLATAQGIREKEHAQFVADSGDMSNNLEAMTGALAALEKGMGSFLQMPKDRVARVTALVQSSNQVDADERETILALLQGKQNPFGDYGAQSGEAPSCCAQGRSRHSVDGRRVKC